MSIGFNDGLAVSAVGATVTSGAGSASVAVPNNSTGGRAKLVRVSATGNLYVKFSVGAATCTTNDVMLTTTPEYVCCQNYDTISYLQEAVAAKLNITPLEV